MVPAFKILSPYQEDVRDEVDLSHDNHLCLLSFFTVLLLLEPFQAPYFMTRGWEKRKITSRCMITRIGCPKGLVHYALFISVVIKTSLSLSCIRY